MSAATAVRIGLVAAVGVYLGSVVALLVVQAPVRVVVAAALAQLVMTSAGVVVVVRSDVSLLGWLLAATGSTVSYWTALQYWDPTGPAAGASVSVVVAHSIAPLTVLPFLVAIAIFPAGRARTRLERATVLFAVSLGLLSVALMTAWAFGLVGGAWTTYRGLFELAILGTVLGAIVNHVRAYRHRPHVEQLQVKYFALVLVVGIVQLPASWAGVPFANELDAVMPGVISLTILLAIVRYRLYEIDRIVSRTVAYTLVVALLAVLGIGGVTGITSLLPAQDRLAVALSTIAVVALFDPLRRRLIDAVDRRFDRTRYVARQVVEGFGRDVQDVTDLDEIGDRVHAVIGRTVAPTTVAVWHPRTGSP